MDSKTANAIALTNHPVARSERTPLPSVPYPLAWGARGCVMSLFATAAAKARVGVFDRQTDGCWNGGTGLGFGGCYQTFPGGEDCFCGFLTDGNERTEKGRKVGEMGASWRNRQMTDDLLRGERCLKDAAATEAWLSALPLRDAGIEELWRRSIVVLRTLRRMIGQRIRSFRYGLDADVINLVQPSADA